MIGATIPIVGQSGAMHAPGGEYTQNQETGTRLAMVSQVENMTRSLRSISEWLKEQRGVLELMGVSRADIRRIRNLTAEAAILAHNGIGQQIIRLAPRGSKIIVPREG